MLKYPVRAAVLVFICFFSLCSVQPATADVKDDGKWTRGTYSQKTKKIIRHEFNSTVRIPDWVPPKKTPSGVGQLTKKQLNAIMNRCWQEFGDSGCRIPNDLTKINDPAAPTVAGPAFRVIAIQLATRLKLPMPVPQFGPDPKNNEWKMLAVGFPVWLWTSGPRTMSSSSSMSGVTFTLTARLRSTSFNTGDGRSVTCTGMTSYSPNVKAGTPSPTCGHVYTKPSLPAGNYRVQAESHWDVTWSVAGFTGVLPVTRTATAELPIGELNALNR